MRNRVNAKILDRLGEKVAENNLPPRSDMQIVDVREIDPLKCNVLIAFERHMGEAPTLSQLERFVAATFHNKVVAQTQTAQLHEADAAISVCLTMNVDTRPVTDATVMRRMTASSYFDDSTGHVWQVVDNGMSKHLIRRTDENIADIVMARMERSSRKSASFARVRQAAPMLAEGDTVRFYDGTMPMVGKVTSLRDTEVTVSANSKSYTVPRESVFNVVERSQSAVGDDKNLLEDYWSRAVGNPDWARKFTRKLNREEDSMAGDTGWSGTVGGEK